MACRKAFPETGSFADDRELYNPSKDGDNSAFAKEPDKFVIPIGRDSKGGILKNATQPHFNEYTSRLQSMSDLMKKMREEQTHLLTKLEVIKSQDPLEYNEPNPSKAFEEYKQKQEQMGK